MFSTLPLLAAALPLVLSSPLIERASTGFNATCNQIQTVISSASGVFYPGSTQYTSDNFHWVPNVEENGACSVQPGTAQDVSAILKLLATTTTPFAIKGGGHTGNPGFSATAGVLISMTRMNQVTYHSNNASVDVGPGQTWDVVYNDLTQFGVTIAGGRVQGVGVAGFTLGGGYSWITNRYGLTIDNTLAYELVLSNGTIVEVTPTSNADLWWALRGGFNNYGIVTKFSFKAITIGQTWGGLINYPASSIPALIQAAATFEATATNLDAQLIVTFAGSNGVMTATALCFFNGATPPTTNNPFATFLTIPQTSNTLATRTFYETVIAVSPPYENPNNLRGAYASARVGNLTLPLIQSMVQQVENNVAKPFESDASFSVGVEPFITTNILKPTTDSLWPHATWFSPTALGAFWSNAANDNAGYASIASMNAAVNVTAATQYDINSIFVYPNYAEATQNTLADMYGPNLARATQIAATYDPAKVMTRSGGFIFQ